MYFINSEHKPKLKKKKLSNSVNLINYNEKAKFELKNIDHYKKKFSIENINIKKNINVSDTMSIDQ